MDIIFNHLCADPMKDSFVEIKVKISCNPKLGYHKLPMEKPDGLGSAPLKPFLTPQNFIGKLKGLSCPNSCTSCVVRRESEINFSFLSLGFMEKERSNYALFLVPTVMSSFT